MGRKQREPGQEAKSKIMKGLRRLDQGPKLPRSLFGQLDFSLRAEGYLRIPLIAWHQHLLLKLSPGSKKSNLDVVGSYTEHFASFFGRMLTDVAEQHSRPHGAGETYQALCEGRD